MTEADVLTSATEATARSRAVRLLVQECPDRFAVLYEAESELGHFGAAKRAQDQLVREYRGFFDNLYRECLDGRQHWGRSDA